MDLASLFPQPGPVTVGGRVVFAAPLRLVDLARLQRYLAMARPCPLESARGAILDAPEGSEARRRLLRDAFRACKGWPLAMGSEEGSAALLTPEGLKFWLGVVLGRDNPELTGAALDDMAGKLTVPEYVALSRTCNGSNPIDELNRLISPDSFGVADGKPAKPVEWSRVIVEVIGETGWTFGQVGELTVGQLAALRTGGKAGTDQISPPRGMRPIDFARRQAAFFGPDRDEVNDGD